MSLTKARTVPEGKKHHCPICDKNWICADDECCFPYDEICPECSIAGEKRDEYYGRKVIP